ncbi:MAG: PQQ-binding-like beta-propeller repeat protein [Deltaproteobacteria bacterium]|nr:PQQ-binding-like beta-propeller repeat protein [Deltaproteobacteria bacterium]
MRRAACGLTLALVTLLPVTARAGGDWPMFRANPANQASAVLVAGASPAARAWTFDGGGRVFGFEPGMTVWSSPALGVAGGRAVLVAGSYDHNVYAVDAASGERLWSYTTGDGVYSAPVLWNGPAGLVAFAASSDRMLYALDAASGRRLWIYAVADFRPTLGGARLSAPAVGTARGRAAVFFGHWVWDRSLAGNQQEGGVTALDAESGAVLWKRLLGDNELTAPIFVAGGHGGRGGTLYLGSTDGSLAALDADHGEVLWRRTELDAIRSAPAAATAMRPLRLLTASKAGLVRCLDAATGAEAWRYQVGDWVTGSPAVLRVRERDLVVLGSYDRSLYALDVLDGSLVWRTFTRGGIHASPAVAATERGPVVLTSSWDHHLYAVDAKDGAILGKRYTGRPLWDTVGLENSNWSSPVAAVLNGVGMSYVGSYDGKLYALPLAELLDGRGHFERSNLAFWLSFPISLSLVTLVALLLTWRHRRRGPPTASSAAAGA